MKGTDVLKPKGILQYRIWRGTELLFEETGYNLVVGGGRDAIAKLIGGDGTDKQITKFAVGTGSTAPVDGDVALTDEFVKAINNVTYPVNGTAQVEFSLEVGEANGKAITEFGLYCEDDTLFSRKVVPTINKTVDIRIEATWKIIF